MEPITWGLIAQLIVKVGLPAAERIWLNAQNNTPVTPAEWKTLRDLNETPFDALMPPKVTP